MEKRDYFVFDDDAFEFRKGRLQVYSYEKEATRILPDGYSLRAVHLVKVSINKGATREEVQQNPDLVFNVDLILHYPDTVRYLRGIRGKYWEIRDFVDRVTEEIGPR